MNSEFRWCVRRVIFQMFFVFSQGCDVGCGNFTAFGGLVGQNYLMTAGQVEGSPDRCDRLNHGDQCRRSAYSAAMKNEHFGVEPTFLSIAKTSAVRLTALKVALVVGTVLCLINHLPDLMHGSFSGVNLMQMALTYTVPFCVSTYSSVKMIRRFVISPNPVA